MDTIQCSRCGLHQFIFITSGDAARCKRCHSSRGFSIIALPLPSTPLTLDQMDAQIRTAVGVLVQKLRKRQNLTQHWVGLHSRTHASEVSRAERGARILSLSSLVRIVKAIGIDGVYLRLRDLP